MTTNDLSSTAIQPQRATPHTARLRRKDAARYCGTSPGFLEKSAVTGRGPPYIRLSKRLVVYDVRDLDAWMTARKVCSTSEIAAN